MNHTQNDIHSQALAQDEYAHWRKKVAWFLSGQSISLFGSALTQYAIIWHITLNTSSGIMIMISTLCSFLPLILISPFAGVWADRHNRKYIIMLADGMIALSTLILAIIFMTGYQELWLLFVVSAIRSVGAGIQTPAVSAMIPQIVPQEKLMRITGISGTIQSLTMLAAPAVSGAILSVFGLETAFFVDVVTAAIAIGILFRIKVSKVVRAPEQQAASVLDDLKAGLKHTWEHSFLRTFFLLYAVMMFLLAPVGLLTPLMTVRSFGEEVWRLTATEMAWSLGMIAGGILLSTWGGFKNRVHTMTLGVMVFGLFTLLLGCTNLFWAYLLFMFVCGITMTLASAASMVLLQECIELGMQGRVFSLLQIVSSAAIPLAMMLFGPLADVVQIEWLLIVTGFLLVLLGGFIPFHKNIKHGLAKK